MTFKGGLGQLQAINEKKSYCQKGWIVLFDSQKIVETMNSRNHYSAALISNATHIVHARDMSWGRGTRVSAANLREKQVRRIVYYNGEGGMGLSSVVASKLAEKTGATVVLNASSKGDCEGTVAKLMGVAKI